MRTRARDMLSFDQVDMSALLENVPLFGNRRVDGMENASEQAKKLAELRASQLPQDWMGSW
jgi:hypothetical protein